MRKGLVFLLLGFFGWHIAPMAIVAAASPPISVYYAGQGGPVHQSLQLAGVQFVDEPSAAQVFVMDGRTPPTGLSSQIANRVRQGAGLVVIMGPGMNGPALAQLLPGSDAAAVRSEPATIQAIDTGRALAQAMPAGMAELLHQINWRSAPQIRKRATAIPGGLEPLVQTFTGQDLVVGYRALGKGHVVWVAPWLDENDNRAFREWPYFNYFVYAITTGAGGQHPVAFADFDAAPVPRPRERQFLLLIVLATFGTTAMLFLWAKRQGKRGQPEALFQAAPEQDRHPKVAGLWKQVGFHRPLAGFLVLLFWGLLFFVPFMIYQAVVLPRYLLPSPQALGAWSLVVSFFNAFWLLFDMGTSLAAIKFLSEYHLDDPFHGLQFVQFYVWWQIVTGTIQVGLVILVAVYLLPHTTYAYLTFYVIAHALVQFPGFYRVFQYVLRALQRLDYDQWLNIAVQPAPGGTGPGSLGFLLIPLQAISVWLLYGWGARHPRFGASMGGGLGMGAGLYLAEVAVFVAGGWLYRRLGYHLRWLFRVQFDWEVARNALRYGALISVGGMIGALGWTAQVWLMERYLFDYLEIQGNWSVAAGLILAFGALVGLYQGLMPAISEAHSHNCIHLARYYVAQGFKYGGWLSAFVASALLATGDRLIIGALGPQWIRAAQFLSLLVIWGALQFPAWFADQVQQGTGHPGLFTFMLFIEQSLRVVLMLLLLPRLQIVGLIIAYLVALPTKDVLTWVLNARLIFRPRIHWWQAAIAPLLAGAMNYLLFRWLGAWLWDGRLMSSLLLFLLASGPGLLWYAFWSGFFGGWDNWGLVELRRAGRSSTLSRPISRPLGWVIGAGASLGPWHGRFPIVLDRQVRQDIHKLSVMRNAQVSVVGSQ
ncbi:MAG: hypothetical protein GXP41_01430 [Chloroflexi bacterium]|nr:hypothetical protein [Chloroflexota bacterium]